MENRLSLHEKIDFAIRRGRGTPIETDLSAYCARAHNLETDSLERIVHAAQSELGMTPHQEQIVASLVLIDSKLAEMRTGEGKTLSAAIAAAHLALSGRRVHLLTANEYLATRDASWMGNLYEGLDLVCTSVTETMPAQDKQTAYGADIIYLTAKQAGFDYLLDSLRFDPGFRVQTELDACIVDEADFLLIDEARHPLVIAARTATDERPDPRMLDRIARQLESDEDFRVDRRGRSCILTAAGERKVSRMLVCDGMHDPEALPLFAAVHVALHAHHLLERGVDYLVKEGRIELIDESTGRVAGKRRWPYGIQAALEAKERVGGHADGRIRTSCTIYDLVAGYRSVAAMTATATPAAEELFERFGLATVLIPPHRTCRFERVPDRVFATRAAKEDALIEEVCKVHATQRPVLIGTGSVSESFRISHLLDQVEIRHCVLNADQDAAEAAVVANAGTLGAVTVSTNMAGRGTDIRLGGPAGIEEDRVRELGGLYVIGTNRHESKRIDDQLLGRAARQGDPGSGRFYVSLEDDLIKRYAVTEFIPAAYLESRSEEEITDPRVSREIDRAQRIIAGQHHLMRRTLRRYTEIVEGHRLKLQTIRWEAVEHGVLPKEIARFHERSDDAAHLFAAALDEEWADHLVWIDMLKEGMHLRRLGNDDPHLAFLNEVSDAFAYRIESAIKRTVEMLDQPTPPCREPVSRRDLDSGNTWTYVASDDPFPAFGLKGLGGDTGRDAVVALMLATVAPLAAVYVVAKLMKRLISRFRANR